MADQNEKAAFAFLRRLFAAAVEAADAARLVPPRLPEAPTGGRAIVVGAGKAAAAMAAAVEAHWPGALEGLVITPYGHGVPTRQIEVVEAAHPLPDQAGTEAARRILERVKGLTPEDMVLCLLSGGGSALMTAPAPGLTLADKQAVTAALLKCGATIAEINCVRKHLSAIKGGRLAEAAWPARLVTLAISDVPGDDPAVIASGPTVADPTSRSDAAAILDAYGIAAPAAVKDHLARAEAETPKPGSKRLAAAEYRTIARPRDALAAAAALARKEGYGAVVLGDDLEGEARTLARAQAAAARQVAARDRPRVLISGGETTVTVTGSGRGGRNGEFALALAVALDGAAGIFAIACDTDGIDGVEENAGALIAPSTLQRGRAAGLDAGRCLDNNDSYGFFDRLGDLVVTGPTRTNVNDFRAILVTNTE